MLTERAGSRCGPGVEIRNWRRFSDPTPNRDDPVPRTAQFAALALMILTFAAGSAMGAPREAPPSTWILKSGRDIPSPQPRKPTLRMQGDKLSGSTGCNSFTGTVIRRTDQRVAIEEVALTRMLCEPKQNVIESAFVSALRATEFISPTGPTLNFLSVDKAPLLVWERQRSSSRGKQARRKAAHVRALKRKGARAHQRRVVHRAECVIFWWR